MTNGGNRGNQYTKVAEVQNGPLPKADDTAQKVADDTGVGRSTVKRAEKFFKGVWKCQEMCSREIPKI